MRDALDVLGVMSQRLALEPLSYEHSDGMFDLWSSAEVCRFSGPATEVNGDPITLPAPTRVESDKIIEFWLHRLEEGAGFRWALLLKGTRSFVGASGFNSLGRVSEYAYHLHPDYWGQGLMLEASRLALSWVASRGGCDAVECFIERDNIRSVRLANRLGFQLIGATTTGTDHYVLNIERAPA